MNPAKKKKSDALVVPLFCVLALGWAAMVFFFSEKLAAAEEERDRLVEQEKEKSVELEKLRREAARLREYTDRLLKDPEFVERFVEREARERIGVGGAGEIVIRAEGH